MSPDTADVVTEAVKKTATSVSVMTHIAERRIEYLLGALIAYQIGLLDKLVTYGSGVCA
jgi:hypothetical protein